MRVFALLLLCAAKLVRRHFVEVGLDAELGAAEQQLEAHGVGVSAGGPVWAAGWASLHQAIAAYLETIRRVETPEYLRVPLENPYLEPKARKRLSELEVLGTGLLAALKEADWGDELAAFQTTAKTTKGQLEATKKALIMALCGYTTRAGTEFKVNAAAELTVVDGHVKSWRGGDPQIVELTKGRPLTAVNHEPLEGVFKVGNLNGDVSLKAGDTIRVAQSDALQTYDVKFSDSEQPFEHFEKSATEEVVQIRKLMSDVVAATDTLASVLEGVIQQNVEDLQ